MTQHERTIEREAAIAVDHVQIAVTDAGGNGAHQHLAAPRLVDLHLLDGQRLMHLAEDGGGHFHGGCLVTFRDTIEARRHAVPMGRRYGATITEPDQPSWPAIHTVQRDAAYDQENTEYVEPRRRLAKHQEADDRRARRKHRDQQSETGPRQPAHRELVAE